MWSGENMSALNAEFAFHISDERVVIFVAVLRSAVVSDDARPTKAPVFCFVVRDDCFTHELSMDRKVLPCVFGNQEPDVGLVDTLCCFSFKRRRPFSRRLSLPPPLFLVSDKQRLVDRIQSVITWSHGPMP
jgi:hypothetical protein